MPPGSNTRLTQRLGGRGTAACEDGALRSASSLSLDLTLLMDLISKLVMQTCSVGYDPANYKDFVERKLIAQHDMNNATESLLGSRSNPSLSGRANAGDEMFDTPSRKWQMLWVYADTTRLSLKTSLSPLQAKEHSHCNIDTCYNGNLLNPPEIDGRIFQYQDIP
jgi:hypothetical protein